MNLPATFQDLNERLKRRPVAAVVVLRLITFLNPAMHWVLAASSIRLPAFTAGTLIGIAPLTITLVLLGEVFMSWWDSYSSIITGTAVAAVVIYVVLQRRKRLATD